MVKITEFYLNKASYIAVDEFGNKIDVNIDYWQNKFGISVKNRELENFVKKLLKKKHKVNFAYKMLE
ncbi:MAG: hypothetical protein NTV24_01975 [Candidatus Woesebacteria bacterium]|nr:hypothetical protein [Candidatus Woesebacteria bacterium]